MNITVIDDEVDNASNRSATPSGGGYGSGQAETLTVTLTDDDSHQNPSFTVTTQVP